MVQNLDCYHKTNYFILIVIFILAYIIYTFSDKTFKYSDFILKFLQKEGSVCALLKNKKFYLNQLHFRYKPISI